MAGSGLRLLQLMRPAMAILPEVSQPDKKVFFLNKKNNKKINQI